MIERLEGTFFGHNDVELFYQLWRPTETRGTIVVTHGIAEHSECYHRFATNLAEEGWTVVGWDLRGHGKSEGKRGYVEDFNHYALDLDAFIKFIKAQIHKRELSLFLFGHSMGGLITLKSLVQTAPSGIKALCLSSPALGVSVVVPKFKVKAAHFLSDWAPKMTLYNEINFHDLHRDKDLIKKYEQDPLRHEKISPRLYLGMMSSIDEVMRHASDVHIPLIMQLAGNEKVVSTPESQKFYELVSSKKKEIHVYQDSRHEILNDLDRETVLRDLKNFLQKMASQE
jgi:alpha-beta hydrolase superfamily lysophospholipase